MLHAMIMAGGGGTRFWPRSRRRGPSSSSPSAATARSCRERVDRIAAQVPPERTLGPHQRAAPCRGRRATEGLVPESQVIGEPTGRDTAACIGLGAALVARVEPDATIMVMPADHLIEPEQEFRRAAHAAEQFASDFPDKLLTFGIQPTFPSTGYGYIRRGEQAGTRQQVPVSRVLRVQGEARSRRRRGVRRLGRILLEQRHLRLEAGGDPGRTRSHKPELHATIAPDRRRLGHAARSRGLPLRVREGREDQHRLRGDAGRREGGEGAGDSCPISVGRCRLVAGARTAQPQDAAGNTIQGLHAGVNTKNCVIVSDPDHLIGTLGVNDLVIIQNGNATLITTRKGEADVKKLVDQIKSAGLGRFL